MKKNNIKRIYVSGKLSADNYMDCVYNTHQMIKYADAIRKKGYAVFVPALDILMGITIGYKKYTDYFNNNISFVEVCDALFVIPNSNKSKGTQKEIALAKKLNKPIFRSLNKLK